MEVYFRSHKLQKLCNDPKAAVREWGDRNAEALRTRLTELRVAENLEQMRRLPQARCHGLTHGRRRGQYSVDLHGLMRLIFTLDDPYEMDAGGGVDWSTVTSVTIVGVEDTHDD